jgi:hypothetical protein
MRRGLLCAGNLAKLSRTGRCRLDSPRSGLVRHAASPASGPNSTGPARRFMPAE